MGPYETALAMAEYGWYVFPVDDPSSKLCSGIGKRHDPFKCRSRGKCSTVKWGEKATNKAQVIHAAWAGTSYNVGVHCGKSGLLVIDEDVPDAFAKYAADHGHDIPATFIDKTADGQHYYFQDTENGALSLEEGALADYGINVRSGNGYVVGPGSVHASGVVYTVTSNIAPAPLPAWVVDAIQTKTNGYRKPGPNGSQPFTNPGNAHERFVLPEVISYRQRDTLLIKYAGSLLARDELSRDEAEVLMERAWQRCEQPADDIYPLEDALEKLARYKPGRCEEYEKRKNGQEQPDPTRHLRVTKAADMTMKATRWLWEDDRDHWVPMGEITGLAGREGVGKSTWSAHLTAEVTKGELLGDFYGKPKGVVIVTTEDDWNATVQPRLVAAGADLNRVFHVRAIQADGLEDTVSLPNDLVEFERVIREYDVALVILDPLLTLINKKLDTHKDAEIRQALGPLTRVAHDTRASFVGLIHVNKSTEGDLMNRIMGSRAIGAVCRAVLFCGSYKPVEDLAEEDDTFAAPNPGGRGHGLCSARSRTTCKPRSWNPSSTTWTVRQSDTTRRPRRTSKAPTWSSSAHTPRTLRTSFWSRRSGPRVPRPRAAKPRCGWSPTSPGKARFRLGRCSRPPKRSLYLRVRSTVHGPNSARNV
jgi:hypothetical protein